MESLDPRIARLEISDDAILQPKEALDQLVTYEVFVQKKDKAAFEHVGIVHASDVEMAFIFAKETFSRRFTCFGMCVVETGKIRITGYTDNDNNIYDQVAKVEHGDGPEEIYEIFHLKKRGKQHVHIGSVEAESYDNALYKAKVLYDDEKPKFNVWVIKNSDILFSDEDDKAIWDTLSDKKYRDATAYRAMDKIKKFKEEQLNQ
ncbi:phenylacetic acid degradation b [Fulvivirgaceae bacterium BMA10]|uniref:Phenylacetic acid degradation b n=1 Tax=Splendidivirga corallicola TaxID=3051826 RepID=A0ABT8KK87_9BACT|nr:phenylacetic acid degradation b [Fulvivirgaceae bacterium BMA10]